MINLWHGVRSVTDILAVNEMPKGTVLKYKMDPTLGILLMQGRIKLPVPANYGFIPRTLDDNGFALGAFIFSNFSLEPLSVSRIRPERLIVATQNNTVISYVVSTLDGDGLDWSGAEKRSDSAIEFLKACVFNLGNVQLLDHQAALDAISLTRANYLVKFGIPAALDHKE